ncbi:MAG: aldehyde dehydrogenase EutE [Elusimicrobia bacterium]|nr:aldehyde dehydrogenase EutE [Elusimicrobiota bacterium]
MQAQEIAEIVGEVLKRLESREDLRAALSSGRPASPLTPIQASPALAPAGASVVHSTVDSAVASAKRAQASFQEQGLEARRKIIKAMREKAVSHAERLAHMAREETGLGRVEDKIRKNLICALRTPGVEDLQSKAYTGDEGLTLVEYAPYGVVAAVTPSTNPAATIINNSISILAAGNAVVFSPHPAAQRTCVEAMRLLSEAAVCAGGPPGLIATVAPASQETTKALLAHPEVRVNMVTGGPAIVKVAMTVGKTCKTIAAGPGNPPAVVDETARFPKCASDIIFGASFDNNVLCTAEKEVIVTRAARERFLESMRRDPRAYELSAAQMDALAKVVIKEGGRGCKDPALNRDFVGKDASVIARAIGLSLPDSARLLWSEVSNDNPWVWTEQLMPVLPVTTAPDVEAAIELAYEAEGGNHHTASMHSMDVGRLTAMGRRMQCSIYVKNAPTLYGLGMGEGYASMSIGTPTGDGLTKASHFARPLHCSLVGYFRIA